MPLSLRSLVRSTFVSVVIRLSTSETKPWPLLLFSMFYLYVSLVIVKLMLDIGLVIVLEGDLSAIFQVCFFPKDLVSYILIAFVARLIEPFLNEMN